MELRDSYEWEPTEVLDGVGPDAIVGVEAALWTETVTTLEELETMLLPRLAAVAEVAWSPAGVARLGGLPRAGRGRGAALGRGRRQPTTGRRRWSWPR